MDIRIIFGEDEDPEPVELDSVPREGELVVWNGESFRVKEVAYDLDRSAGLGTSAVVIRAEPHGGNEAWFV